MESIPLGGCSFVFVLLNLWSAAGAKLLKEKRCVRIIISYVKIRPSYVRIKQSYMRIAPINEKIRADFNPAKEHISL